MMHISLDLETWGKRAGFDLRSIGAVVFDPMTGIVGANAAYEKTDFKPPHPDIMDRIREGTNPYVFYIATDNPHRSGLREEILAKAPGFETEGDRKYPLKRDPSTVQWWNDQSEEAQAAFADPIDLRLALQRLTHWLDIVTKPHRPIINPSYVPGLQNPDGSYEMIDVRAHGVEHDIRIPLHKWSGLRIWTHGPGFDPPILEAAFHAVGLPVPWFYRALRDTRTLFDTAGIDPEADGSYRTFMSQYNTGTAHNALDDAIAQARCICAASARVTAWSDAYNRMQDDGK